MDDKPMPCTACKGTGKQAFHGPFVSYMGKCNFCAGHGAIAKAAKEYGKRFRLDYKPAKYATRL